MTVEGRTATTQPRRNGRLAARLHWALLPAIGAYYYADAFNEKVPMRWRIGYRLMKLVERLPGSDLFEPMPPIVCDCDDCRFIEAIQ